VRVRHFGREATCFGRPCCIASSYIEDIDFESFGFVMRTSLIGGLFVKTKSITGSVTTALIALGLAASERAGKGVKGTFDGLDPSDLYGLPAMPSGAYAADRSSYTGNYEVPVPPPGAGLALVNEGLGPLSARCRQ
jgi:hypothetical protein